MMKILELKHLRTKTICLLVFVLTANQVGGQNLVDEKGRKQGAWKTIELNRNRITIECVYQNDTLNGAYKEFDKKGQIIVETNYVSGKLEGDYSKYWSDKIPLVKTTYLNGLTHGQYYWYDHKGRLMKSIEFENGKWDGQWKSYLKGRLVAQANFKSDILDGDFLIFYENGTIAMKSIFRDGKMVSGEMSYNKEGKLTNIKLPIETRDKLGAIVFYKEDGTEKKTEIIDEYPITRIYFGAGAHKTGPLDLKGTEDKLR